MLTLSYGYKKPQTNDKGPVVFPALEANIQQLNDHNHDGANSAPISALAITRPTQSILSANWVATSGGEYRQAVTLLAGFNFDTVTLSFRLPSGDYVQPTVEKISSSQFYVYTNDSTLTYTAVYGG